MSRAVNLEQLKEVVSKLKTAERVANYYHCSRDVAERMIVLAQRSAASQEANPTVLTKTTRPSSFNPKSDPLEWSWQKQKMEMENGSRNLLIAMLIEGQHWLSDDQATKKARELGLIPYPTT